MAELSGTSASNLSPQEKAVLNTYKEWLSEDPNTTVYLAGSARGSIDLDEEAQRFSIREGQSMSENFIEQLKKLDGVRVVDARVSAEQTLGLLNEMSSQQFKPAMQVSFNAANDDLDLDDSEDFSPGMR